MSTRFPVRPNTLTHLPSPCRRHDCYTLSPTAQRGRLRREWPMATTPHHQHDACLDLGRSNSAGSAVSYGSGGEGRPCITLIKMHGSINGSTARLSRSADAQGANTCATLAANDIRVPSRRVPDLSRSSRQFIVPPTAFKYLASADRSRSGMRGARRSRRRDVRRSWATHFSDANDYLAKMMLKALGKQPDKHVVIVDTAKETIDPLRGYITRHARAFDESAFMSSSALGRYPATSRRYPGRGLDRCAQAPKAPRRAKAAVPQHPCPTGADRGRMTVRAILFDQGDTLWHFPRMPAPAELGAEASRRASPCSSAGAARRRRPASPGLGRFPEVAAR